MDEQLLEEWDYYSGDEDDEENYYVDSYNEHSVIPVRDGATISELYAECLEPTFQSAINQVVWLLCSCLCFRIFSQLLQVPRPLCHASSFVFGLAGLYSVIGSSSIYTIIFAVFCYGCLVFCAKFRLRRGDSCKFIACLLLVYLVIREYVHIPFESWEQVRGVQMIMVLKVLSISFDMKNGHQRDLPPYLDYLGYVFCPANVIFGPWIPFSVYYGLFHRRKWTFGCVIQIFATGLRSLLSLGVSSCMVYWTFLGISSSWLLATRDALSFRFSHYFISFLSETTSLLSGFPSDANIEVTVPWKIELPRSLVEVVVYWNMPMHRWLKTYVFRPASHLSAFLSVFLTFLVSSMLHGMNFGLTMVLISLGLYTYIEHNLREKLASVFDACIRSRACPLECQHVYKSNQLIVRLVNFGFGMWAYFHLIYLGVMMDKTHSDDDASNGMLENIIQDLQKWKNLSFTSHWTMLLMYLGSIVI